MKKLIFLILLMGIVIFTTAQTASYSMKSSNAMTANANYTLTNTVPDTFLIYAPRNYPASQSYSVNLDSLSGDHTNVAVSLYGSLLGVSYTQIGSTANWTGTSEATTTITISNAVANRYNYYKIIILGTGTGTTTIDWQSFQIWSAGELSDGTATLSNGAFTGITTIGMSGRLTGTGGVTITGAASNINANSNYATNINTGSSSGALTLGGNSGTVEINSSDWDISTTGAMTGIGAITSDGLITATGGLTLATNPTQYWAAGGSVITAATGTDVAFSNGARWWVEVNIPYNNTITGAGILLGTVGGTDSIVIQLCNSSGVEVATTRHGSTGKTANLVGTTATFQDINFVTPYAAVAGRYFIVIQSNGTTAKFRAYAIPGLKIITGTVAGTWGTAANITPGTSFTADKGPISFVY